MTPRAVGSSNYYEMSLLDGGGRPIGKPYQLMSVTTILKALPKELSWWGYKIGLLEGRRLADKAWVAETGGSKEFSLPSDDEAFYEEVKRLAREENAATTPQNVMEKAGDRGSNVHDYAEKVFRDGEWPNKDDVPAEQRGYVVAMKRWFDTLPEHEVIAVEVNLASLEHKFAGTCDLIIKSGGAYHVIDFKTSKGIYESHLLQVTAYEHAAVEQGYIPEGAAHTGQVVRFGADGKYATKTSPCYIEDFLAVKKVFDWLVGTGWRP